MGLVRDADDHYPRLENQDAAPRAERKGKIIRSNKSQQEALADPLTQIVMADTNRENVKEARLAGLEAPGLK